MINSRTKGSKNERNVAKLMADWSGYEFARTPQSGGLHWKKQYTSGDIVCIDERHGSRFPFSIECKFHESLDLLHLIDNTVGKKSNKITLFWDQAETDAKQVNKIPLLFMRRNGMKAGMQFVVMPTNFFLLWLSGIEPWHNKYGIFHYFKTSDSKKDYHFTIINSDDLIITNYRVFYKLGKKVRKKCHLKNTTTSG